MVYRKLRSEGLDQGGLSETPARALEAPCWLASWRAGGRAGGCCGTLSGKPVSSAESLWPLAGVGQAGVTAGLHSPGLPAAPEALLRCTQADPGTTAGPGEGLPLLTH